MKARCYSDGYAGIAYFVFSEISIRRHQIRYSNESYNAKHIQSIFLYSKFDIENNSVFNYRLKCRILLCD